MPSVIEACKPRDDILRGTFNPEVFTASLSHVVSHYRGGGGAIASLYSNAEQFFREGTYATDGMRQVLHDVLTRLSGDATAPAIYRLETAFGGGKTHTLVALLHLAFRGDEIAEVAHDAVGGAPFPKAGDVAVAALAGDELAVHKPRGADLVPYTLWGEIAYQVGGAALYHDLDELATSRDAPPKAYFDNVFGGRKAIVLLDELALYAARLDVAVANGGEQLAAFLFALHGYARDHSGLVVVTTLASAGDAFSRQTQQLSKLLGQVSGTEVSEDEAKAVAERAEHDARSVVARDATSVTPVQSAEISRVLAKRLFV